MAAADRQRGTTSPNSINCIPLRWGLVSFESSETLGGRSQPGPGTRSDPRMAIWFPFWTAGNPVPILFHACVTSHRQIFHLLRRARRNWLLLAAVSTALLYSNYFGLALLGCLGLDALVENRGNLRNSKSLLVGMIALPMIADIPLQLAFLQQTRSGTDFRFGLGRMLHVTNRSII
jgi:hypothetical protein